MQQIPPAFSKKERNELLTSYWRVHAKFSNLMDRGKYDEARKYRDEARKLKTQYLETLPLIVMSCCPFDDKPLARTFDPYGLDGFWWHDGTPTQEPPACTHFCVLQGAVNYRGLKPLGGKRQVTPGPEAPFVMPRLLEMPGMIAVISEIDMDCGYMAYPIAYFAEKRPPVEELTANWTNAEFVYTTQLGEKGWKISNDVWDFELEPWLRRGKIRWCIPGSNNTDLSTDPPEACPYVNIPGRKAIVIVDGDKSWTMGLPDGTLIPPS